jgi:phthalate 4,5-cis-dihydrodiol dehydrogenase
MARALRLGVLGLGQGAAGMIPSMEAMPEIELVAGADINPVMRDGFRARFKGRPAYSSLAELCKDPNVEAVYIATPNRFHAPHAIEAMRYGKHVAVEKPIAITLEEADQVCDEERKNGVKLLAAHTRSFSIWNRAMRRIILSGVIGPVRAIHIWAYTDWMLRPRTPDELDPNEGGGIVFRQGPHQIDTMRLLGGGKLRSVRGMTGRWMDARPVPGYFTAYLEFEDGTAGTIMHNGYGYFMMADLYPWVTEKRSYTEADRVKLRKELQTGSRDEESEKQEFRVGGKSDPTAIRQGGPQPWKPFDLGPVEVSCERGCIRPAQFGLSVYGDEGRRDIDLTHLWRPEPDPSGGLSLAVLEELHAAVVLGRPMFHNAQWGRATLEAILAVVDSARERREIILERQVAMPDEYDADLQVDEVVHGH